MESLPTTTPPVRKREIFGWAMFDFANSSYTTLIVTVAFSVYFTKLVAAGPRADFLWGIGIFLSNAMVVLTAPVLGSIADEGGRKKMFLFATYALCVSGTLALYWVLPGMIGLGMGLFVISNIGYSLGENLCGAFLPEISTPATIGRISGFGWGLGYLGGLGCLLLAKPLLTGGFELGNLASLRRVWLMTGVFFLVGALPTFLFLRERAPRHPLGSVNAAVGAAWRRLRTTARSIAHFRQLARFLTVFFVFSCGLTAVIAYAAVYAERTVGFSPGDLVLLFILLQLTSTAGAVGFGFLQDRLGASRTIVVTLVLWLLVCVATAAIQTATQFWAVALFAGLGIGSLQSASRGLVGLLSPVSKAGEFFGFWGLAGKAAYAVGPITFGLVSSASGSQRAAVVAVAGFFLAGLIGMRWIDEQEGRAAVETWSEPARAEPGLGLHSQEPRSSRR
jgi:UMF1 family MFS transporter